MIQVNIFRYQGGVEYELKLTKRPYLNCYKQNDSIVINHIKVIFIYYRNISNIQMIIFCDLFVYIEHMDVFFDLIIYQTRMTTFIENEVKKIR